MHLSGYGGVNRAPMRRMKVHLCVLVKPSVRVESVSVLRDTGGHTVIGPCVLGAVEHQKEEEFVIL